MDWVIRRLNQKNSYRSKKSGNINGNTKESKRLKVCNGCNNVWESKFSGGAIYYESFPTYKLERKYCYKCKRKNKNVK